MQWKFSIILKIGLSSKIAYLYLHVISRGTLEWSGVIRGTTRTEILSSVGDTTLVFKLGGFCVLNLTVIGLYRVGSQSSEGRGILGYFQERVLLPGFYNETRVSSSES